MKKPIAYLAPALLLLGFGTAAFAVQCPALPPAEEGLALHWYRNSAEKIALYREIYRLAEEHITQVVKMNHLKPRSFGVIMDIDETVLDNTWFHSVCHFQASGDDFSREVIAAEQSEALPGAVHFTKLVHKLGGYVSLVSNRDGTFQDPTHNALEYTAENLKKAHITFDQIVLANPKTSPSPYDKNARFEAILTGTYDPKQMTWTTTLPAHSVIAYLGDNIQDFPKFNQTSAHHLASDDSSFDAFGHAYFIFPNPLYGSWVDNPSK